MATKVFSLYKYQILPVSSQFNLLYDINKILENKNYHFKNALLSLKDISSGDLESKCKFEMIRKDNDSIFFIASKVKNVQYYTERHIKSNIPSYPPVHVIVDNSKTVQTIAVENSKEYTSTGVFIKNLEKSLTKILKGENLIVKFSPIYQESSFWDFVEKNKDNITCVSFSLVTPNMANISKKLSEDLKTIAKMAQAAVTEYSITAEKGTTLHLDKENAAISDIEDYAAKGGGETKVRLKRRRWAYKSNDYQKTVEFEDVELSGSLDVIKTKLREFLYGDDR